VSLLLLGGWAAGQLVRVLEALLVWGVRETPLRRRERLPLTIAFKAEELQGGNGCLGLRTGGDWRVHIDQDLSWGGDSRAGRQGAGTNCRPLPVLPVDSDSPRLFIIYGTLDILPTGELAHGYCRSSLTVQLCAIDSSVLCCLCCAAVWQGEPLTASQHTAAHPPHLPNACATGPPPCQPPLLSMNDYLCITYTPTL